MNSEQLKASFTAAGQEQVFSFWPQLNATERDALAAQAAEIDLAEIARLHQTLVAKTGGAGVSLDGLTPAPFTKLVEHGGHASEWTQATAAGEAALRGGKVAAFTVAGGQGT